MIIFESLDEEVHICTSSVSPGSAGESLYIVIIVIINIIFIKSCQNATYMQINNSLHTAYVS